MRPSEVRARILEDHDGLREDIDRLETLARRVHRNEADPGDLLALRGFASTLLGKLQIHMRWEELLLLPALQDADAWGEERARRLTSDHREQRALLDFILERLRDAGRPGDLVFSDVLGLIAFLREDMEQEERELLDERVLRDDIVAIAMETG